MTPKDRTLVAVQAEKPDHVPLCSWVLRSAPPKHLQWEKNGAEVADPFMGKTKRIHTLPEPRDVTHGFRRGDACLSPGVGDVLDMSAPWGSFDHVSWADSMEAYRESTRASRHSRRE